MAQIKDVTGNMLVRNSITYAKIMGLPEAGVWDPKKVMYRKVTDRMAYWMFRATGTEEFFRDCYKVEVHGTQVVIWYWLKNRKGKHYLNPYNRAEAAHAALTIDWAEIPDWMRT